MNLDSPELLNMRGIHLYSWKHPPIHTFVRIQPLQRVWIPGLWIDVSSNRTPEFHMCSSSFKLHVHCVILYYSCRCAEMLLISIENTPESPAAYLPEYDIPSPLILEVFISIRCSISFPFHVRRNSWIGMSTSCHSKDLVVECHTTGLIRLARAKGNRIHAIKVQNPSLLTAQVDSAI